LRGLTDAQRALLSRAIAHDASACEVPVPRDDARDLVARGIASPGSEGGGWHDIDIAKASFALRADAAARNAGVWP
jgi:hypothetical protein